MQLIRISHQPIQYQYEIEHARLEMKQAQNAEPHMTHDPSQMSIRSKNIEVRLDTTDLRASLNLRTPTAFAKEFGSRGMQAAVQATGDAVEFGNQMQQIQDGVTIAQIVRQKLLTQPATYTTFLPSVGPDISWDGNSMEMRYDPGSVATDWKIMRNQMDFIPGKFRMNILQYPKVTIEYLGEPNYVPPSAAPGFEETA